MTDSRLSRIARLYAAACSRARAALAAGDRDGYRYSIAEARRLSRIMSEG